MGLRYPATIINEEDEFFISSLLRQIINCFLWPGHSEEAGYLSTNRIAFPQGIHFLFSCCFSTI